MDLNAEEKELAKDYEVAYLVSPNISEDKIIEVVNRLKTVLEKAGAFVASEEYPRFRQLAYTLVKRMGGKNEKYTSAYFGWIKFSSSADRVSDVKDTLKRETQIIRFLVVKTDENSRTRTRPTVWRRTQVKKDMPVKTTEPALGMTDAEIDKTIDELVVE